MNFRHILLLLTLCFTLDSFSFWPFDSNQQKKQSDPTLLQYVKIYQGHFQISFDHKIMRKGIENDFFQRGDNLYIKSPLLPNRDYKQVSLITHKEFEKIRTYYHPKELNRLFYMMTQNTLNTFLVSRANPTIGLGIKRYSIYLDLAKEDFLLGAMMSIKTRVVPGEELKNVDFKIDMQISSKFPISDQPSIQYTVFKKCKAEDVTKDSIEKDLLFLGIK